MPLTFNLRHIETKALELAGALPSEELELELHDEMIRPAGPLQYDLTVQNLEGAVLVQEQERAR